MTIAAMRKATGVTLRGDDSFAAQPGAAAPFGTKPDDSVTLYRLEQPDIARLRRLQTTVAAWGQPDAGGTTGSFSMGWPGVALVAARR